MCGRFAMDQSTDDLIQEFVAEGGDYRNWRPSYNVAPSETVPVVRERQHAGETTRQLDAAVWGLRPSWSKGKGPAPINARLESVASNGMFRSAFANRRCIVPMTGYYEWEERPDGKQPHFIHGQTGVMAAAGIYESQKQPDGAWTITMSIITREARDASGEIHDRMPVFLTPDVYGTWLRPGKVTEPQPLLEMLDRASLAVAATTSAYPVSRRVNDARNLDAKEDPTLIEPLAG
jgi:putative SOS response-associated peptidase YedK